jgi:uncharacterized protein (DUF2147 family)
MKLLPRSRLSIPSLLAAVMLAMAIGSAAQAQPQPTAAGLWEQVDDVSGKPEGWFRIAEKNGIYDGVLVKAFPKPGEEGQEWFCTKCEGAEKNAPVIGLALIKNMKRTGLSYEGGTIMDPRDGAVYKALMELSPDGQKLTVRGFLGISLFGRSQVWNRLPDNAMNPAPAARRTPATPANPAAKK